MRHVIGNARAELFPMRRIIRKGGAELFPMRRAIRKGERELFVMARVMVNCSAQQQSMNRISIKRIGERLLREG